jgi:hypothetical protein
LISSPSPIVNLPDSTCLCPLAWCKHGQHAMCNPLLIEECSNTK